MHSNIRCHHTISLGPMPIVDEQWLTRIPANHVLVNIAVHKRPMVIEIHYSVLLFTPESINNTNHIEESNRGNE